MFPNIESSNQPSKKSILTQVSITHPSRKTKSIHQSPTNGNFASPKKKRDHPPHPQARRTLKESSREREIERDKRKRPGWHSVLDIAHVVIVAGVAEEAEEQRETARRGEKVKGERETKERESSSLACCSAEPLGDVALLYERALAGSAAEASSPGKIFAVWP